MKKSRYLDNQIMAILQQAEVGAPVSGLCREHGMSSASFYKWRSKYVGMDASMIVGIKELEAENSRLKRMQDVNAEGREAALGQYNREGLIIEADLSMPAIRVIRALAWRIYSSNGNPLCDYYRCFYFQLRILKFNAHKRD